MSIKGQPSVNAFGRCEFSVSATAQNHQCVGLADTSSLLSSSESFSPSTPDRREQCSTLLKSCTTETRFGDARGRMLYSRSLSRVISAGGLLATLLLFGCDLVPSKPDAVFVLYRDRMKSEKLKDARQLLTAQSRALSAELTEKFGLKEAPENLALLNVLDPVTPPVITQSEANTVLLQVRTLKGGVRLVRLVRSKADSSWAVDITPELKALGKFLSTRKALDTVREQAGEYAASWRAFSDQLGKMRATAPPPLPKTRLQDKTKSKADVKKTAVKGAKTKPRTSGHRRKPSRRRTVNRNNRSR